MNEKRQQPEDNAQMAEFSIGRDGRRYHYNGHRYDKWQDAVAYARLMRDRPWQANAAGSFVPGIMPATATAAQHALMTSLGVRLDEGVYRFGEFRYDRLTDALDYAKRAPLRSRD